MCSDNFPKSVLPIFYLLLLTASPHFLRGYMFAFCGMDSGVKTWIRMFSYVAQIQLNCSFINGNTALQKALFMLQVSG